MAPELAEKITKMWTDGVVLGQMAVELQMAKTTVWRRVRELDLPRRPRVSKRSVVVRVGLTDELFDKLQRRANAAGSSKAQFLRQYVQQL